MTDITKLNKTLQQYLADAPVNDYENAKKCLDDISTYAVEHGMTDRPEFMDYLHEAVDRLPRENEVAINLRIDKDIILGNEEAAGFVSLLFDFVEQWNLAVDKMNGQVAEETTAE